MNTRNNGLLRLIAVFKFVKATILVTIGFEALRLHRNDNAAGALNHIAERLGLLPGGRLLDHAVSKLTDLSPREFRNLGIGSFIYASLFLTEGLGLWLGKAWAEWFTTIITGSLVPVELFEIYRHPTIPKIVISVLNLAIVVYLIARLRKTHNDSR